MYIRPIVSHPLHTHTVSDLVLQAMAPGSAMNPGSYRGMISPSSVQLDYAGNTWDVNGDTTHSLPVASHIVFAFALFGLVGRCGIGLDWTISLTSQ